MASAREMRVRIRSVKNISQVTRALEAVSEYAKTIDELARRIEEVLTAHTSRVRPVAA